MNPELLLRLVWAGIVVVAAGIGYTLVDGALFLLRGTGPAPVAVSAGPGPDLAQSANGPRSGPENIDLAALNLFGNPTVAPTVLPTAETAPETRLKITLIGVFVADRNQDSVAIIGSGRSEETYKVGDSLPGNATLVEVHPTYVLLKRAGGHERLSFEEPQDQIANADAGSDERSSSRAAPVRLSNRTSRGSATNPGRDSLVGVPRAADRAREAAAARRAAALDGVQTAREFLDTYGERLASDPDDTLAELGIEPVEAGSAAGYRLADVASPAALSRVGLRPGDVVLSVNGQQLGNTDVDSALVDQLSDAGAARLEIQRGQRRFFVTLSIPRTGTEPTTMETDEQ